MTDMNNAQIRTMPELQQEVTNMVDRVAKRQAGRGASEEEIQLTRLEVFGQLKRREGPLDEALQALVDELRADGVPWTTQSARFGTSYSAYWNEFSKTPTTTPADRKKRVAEAQPRLAPVDLPGVKISDAVAATGVRRGRIDALIRQHPDAAWFARTEVGGKRGYVLRILDLDALLALAQVDGRSNRAQKS